MVRFDRELIAAFRGPGARQLQVFARNPERNTVMGGTADQLQHRGSPPNVSDIERGRRPGTYEDLCDLVKLNHALGVIHLVGGAVVEPLDLPVPTRHLDNVYAILRYTDRPIMARAVSRVPRRGRDRHGGDRARASPSRRWRPSRRCSRLSTSIRRAASTRSCSMA